MLSAALLAGGCGSTATDGKDGAPEGQPAAERPQLLLASTIGPIDAGIVDLFEQEFEKKTGIRVRHVGAGTGAALNIARQGHVDLVMVHAKALEEQFVAEGWGTQRYDLMYNDFVMVGPESDPAGIRGEADALAALRKIAAAEAHFISRGDNSGTNVKEKELWQAAGITPEGDWYEIFARGAEGNSATLRYTNEQGAYTLIDRATVLALQDELKLEVLCEKDEELLNYISVIPVNPEKCPNVDYQRAMQFVEWLQSQECQRLIKEFGVDKYGAPMFFPNSPEGRKLA